MNNYTQSYVSNRTSKIADYGQLTDQLYDPLRVTITRASKSPFRPSSQNKPIQSRISKAMRELTPQKADQMKKTTFIPVDKKLVPTNHIYKVRGKQFQAINVQERQYQPITAEQMQYIIEQGRLNQQSETVYEFQDEAIYYNMAPSIRASQNYGGKFQQSQYYLPQSPKYIKTQASPIYSINRNQHQSTNNLNSMETQIERINSVPVYSFNPLYHQNIQRNNSQTVVNAIRTTKEPYKITPINQNKRNQNRNISRGSHVSSNALSVSRYSFKDNIDRRPVSKPKSQYKYNLFSAIDLAVNSGCKGCGGNQIIAKSPSRIK